MSAFDDWSGSAGAWAQDQQWGQAPPGPNEPWMQAAMVPPPWPGTAASISPPWPCAATSSQSPWPTAAGAWPTTAAGAWPTSDGLRSLAGGFHSITLVAAPVVKPRAPVPLRNSFDALCEEDEAFRVHPKPTLADYIVQKAPKRTSKPSKKRRGKGITFSTGSSSGN